jgi:hypothetical protein
MMRTNDALELIDEAPLAFVLAAVIGLRAKFTPGVSLKGLNPGEAFLGDWKRCGMTQQQYRTAKAQLAKWKFATFKATNKGTVGKLIDTRLFDPLNIARNEPANERVTSSQRAANEQVTTNKQINTGNTLNNVPETSETGCAPRRHFPLSVEEVLEHSLTRIGCKTSGVKRWLKGANLKRPSEVILAEVPNDDTREAMVWAFRFIHYNNGMGWKLMDSWRAAFDGFKANCDHGAGPSDVPLKWIPHIQPPP